MTEEWAIVDKEMNIGLRGRNDRPALRYAAGDHHDVVDDDYVVTWPEAETQLNVMLRQGTTVDWLATQILRMKFLVRTNDLITHERMDFLKSPYSSGIEKDIFRNYVILKKSLENVNDGILWLLNGAPFSNWVDPFFIKVYLTERPNNILAPI